MNGIPARFSEFNDRQVRDRAVVAARGDASFDILIRGGTLVDMVTGELRAADIGIVGPLIASVHETGSRTDAQLVMEARGGYVSPGLIDTHMHVESSMVTPAAYARAVLPRGVTTIVWDPHEFGNVHGIDGVAWAVSAAEQLPLRTIVLAPSCVPSAPGMEAAGADLDAGSIDEMLSWPRIGGLAEVMNMQGVIGRDARMSAIVQTALLSEKLVCGHARSLGGAELAAFMAAGITSDHELVSGDDLIAKLRAGLSIEMRGSHGHLLPEFVSALRRLGHLPPTVTLCTDDVFPDDLIEGGGLDDVVRRLVRYGMRPEWALRAATFNAALRLGRHDLGLIGPGRRADIVVFDDLKQFKARHVLASGKPVATHGQMLAEPASVDPGPLQGSVKLKPLREADFRIPTEGRKVRIATIDRPRFTRWGKTDADVVDGYVVPPDGSTLIAVTHRHGRTDTRTRLGFLTGWGQWKGAFATTLAHDSHNLTVFGVDPLDMTVAANAVIEAGGGMAVAANGQVQALLPLPLSGLVSEASLDEVADGFRAVRLAMDKVVDWQPPYLVFKACFGATLACNPGPHQTDRGIADVAKGVLLESPILEILE